MSPPAQLGPFEILELLGEGGSGVVYAARGPDGREVALKVLRPELDLEPREVQRFVEEAGRMRRVSHPGLVPVLDVGMLPDGRPFIAMPQLRGRSLAERIASEGPIPPARALAMFTGLAAALGALHEAGLVHRDVKPENVLWVDGEDRLVLLDLGIARDADAIASTTTRAGLTRGTPAYMAPERFFGRSATIRTDVYELALLFYVMVVGALPWDGEDPRGRLSPKHPAERGVALPTSVVTVLLAALDVDFERRPGSVADLAAQLEAALARASEEPSETVRDGQGGRGPLLVVTPASPRDAATDPQLAQAPTQVSPPRAFPIDQPTMPSGPMGSTPAHVATVATAPPPPRASGGARLLAAGATIAIVAGLAGALAVGAFRREPANAPPAVVTQQAKKEVVEPAPTAQEPSAAPSATAEASADAPLVPPSASASASPSARPVADSPSSSASSGPGAPGPGAMPVPCRALITLMCDPKSGATPAECAAWKGNVASWQTKLPPKVTTETCQSALDASQKGLALRRESKQP